MSLYDAKTAIDFHRIIRTNYRHYDMKIESLPAVLPMIKQHLMSKMPSTQFLDYSFATDYIADCKHYYRISCGTSVFHIVSRGRPDITNIKTAINDVMNIKQLYKIQKSLQFYLLMNPMKRFFAKKGDIMKAKNINGGFTNPYSNSIYIIRNQEYAKVMLHELLHHNTSINKHDWHPATITKLKLHFNIHSMCNFYPNEAVIETIAYMIYMCFVSLHRHLSFKQVLKKESEHSCALANKIIRMQNNQAWYEETNTYCYIVFKYIFLCNFDRFMKIMRDERQLSELLISIQIPHMHCARQLKLVYF